MYAMFLLPFEHWVHLLLPIGLTMILAVQFLSRQQQSNLLLIHSNDGWTFQYAHPAICVSGALVQAGYRSAWLIILVIQSDDTALHRVAIWKDQVSSVQFSYLHQQLAFAADPPARRRLSLWLKDCLGMQPPTLWHQSTRANTTLRRQTRNRAKNTLD